MANSELAKTDEPKCIVTVVKEGSLPPFTDRKYWDDLAKAVDRLGLNNQECGLLTDGQ